MAVINNIKINSNFQHGCKHAEQHGKATEVHRSLMSVRREHHACCDLTYVLADEDYKEGSDKVIYPLNISAGRMTDGPYEQDPFKNLKEKWTAGGAESKHSRNFLNMCILKTHVPDTSQSLV